MLILPFFDDPAVQAIRNRYSFEEPWDGPRNRLPLGDKGFFGTPYESARGLDKAKGAYGLFVAARGAKPCEPRAR